VGESGTKWDAGAFPAFVIKEENRTNVPKPVPALLR
jgi:hypothetical protein